MSSPTADLFDSNHLEADDEHMNHHVADEEVTAEDCDSDEYDSDEPPALEVDFKALKDYASACMGVECISAKKLTKGTFHEIFVLGFNDKISTGEKSCIARLTRESQFAVNGYSEIETMKFVQEKTSIPIPQVFASDLDPDNKIGAAVVLLQHMPGQDLYDIWDHMSLDHKKNVVGQLTKILASLSTLKFDTIGSIRDGVLGPIVQEANQYDSAYSTGNSRGPFNTTYDFLASYLPSTYSEESAPIFSKVQQILKSYLQENSASYLHGPFPLLHPDFDGQNLLFEYSPDSGEPPRLTAVLDWECAATGPLYFLYEYPIFIQNNDYYKDKYAECAVLRQHFRRELANAFPEGSAERSEALECMREKTHVLHGFQGAYMHHFSDEDECRNSAAWYVKRVEEGTGEAYYDSTELIDEGQPGSEKIDKGQSGIDNMDEGQSAGKNIDEGQSTGRKTGKTFGKGVCKFKCGGLGWLKGWFGCFGARK